mmetsp:Transcript_40399/g.86017  ORF Transcript_40399/g.86017 Transcript_40399/m.86017 type:complete len:80 (-) Transcript_40399:23-262(-)
MHHDTIAVGAFAHDGAVYVFRRDSRVIWRRQERVSPDDGDGWRARERSQFWGFKPSKNRRNCQYDPPKCTSWNPFEGRK